MGIGSAELVVSDEPIDPDRDSERDGGRGCDELGALIERERGRFLRTGAIGALVRPEIRASWRRSVLGGFSQGSGGPRYCSNVNLDCQMMRVARPVISEREPLLAGSGHAFVVTDAEVRILYRSGCDERLLRRLDEELVRPGYCFAEDLVGTNAAAIAIETGEAAEVHGAEHLSLREPSLSCAAVPVVHPVQGRALGTLGLVCDSDRATSLATPWLLDVVAQVEQRLRDSLWAEEQRLFDAYLAAPRSSRHPLVCISERTIVSNPRAARVLGADDQALLWEHASRAMASGEPVAATLELASGNRVSADCSPIFDGDSPVAARIELRPEEGGRASRSARSRDLPASGTGRESDRIPRLPGLVGRSPRWERMRCDLAQAVGRGSLLLYGEPGAGKRSVALALFAGETIELLDAALHVVEGPASWLRRVRDRLAAGTGVVLVTHLESLDPKTGRALLSLLEQTSGTGPRVVATVNSTDGDPGKGDPAAGWFTSSVEVPPLRDRPEDLRQLVEAFAAPRLRGAEGWRWMPDSIQALMRVEWPQNLRTLRRAVEQTVAGRRPGYVDTHSLPSWIRAAASRRKLTRLEQVEATAIAIELSRSGGNKLEAAKRLGIARSTLYRRIRTLGIALADSNY